PPPSIASLSSDGRVMVQTSDRRTKTIPSAATFHTRERSRKTPAAYKARYATRPQNRAEHPTRSSNCAWPQHALLGRLQQTGGNVAKIFRTPLASRPATPVNADTASSRELAVQT